MEKLSQWRLMFCPDGVKPYHALHKTLNDLPGGVPAPLLLKLKEVRLPRPITRRLELIATILAGHARARNYHVFAHATAPQIKEAIGRVSRSVSPDGRFHYSARRTEDIARVVGYLVDFPEVHHGNIVGLADKAIRWHRRDRQEQIQEQVGERLGKDTPNRQTADPPPRRAWRSFSRHGARGRRRGRVDEPLHRLLCRASEGWPVLPVPC